jgi:hypothetical protein
MEEGEGVRYRGLQFANRGRVLEKVVGQVEARSLCVKGEDLLGECMRTGRKGRRRIETAEDRMEGQRFGSWTFWRWVREVPLRVGSVADFRVERKDLLLSCYFQNTF